MTSKLIKWSTSSCQKHYGVIKICPYPLKYVNLKPIGREYYRVFIPRSSPLLDLLVIGVTNLPYMEAVSRGLESPPPKGHRLTFSDSYVMRFPQQRLDPPHPLPKPICWNRARLLLFWFENPGEGFSRALPLLRLARTGLSQVSRLGLNSCRLTVRPRSGFTKSSGGGRGLDRGGGG